MKPQCETCGKSLPMESLEAYICSYECTFCSACCENVHQGICPNCKGQLLKRPSRIVRHQENQEQVK